MSRLQALRFRQVLSPTREASFFSPNTSTCRNLETCPTLAACARPPQACWRNCRCKPCDCDTCRRRRLPVGRRTAPATNGGLPESKATDVELDLADRLLAKYAGIAA